MHKEEHCEAKKIVLALKQKGFVAYFAGGWVRDYLLGYPSDDIDIATNATPDLVQKFFEKTIPIGLKFGIILVLVDGKQFEVATFRADFDYTDGRRPSRIEFCDEKIDASRRDFTINGMFFDPIEEKIIDYVSGEKDLKKGLIRAIGNPEERFREDRLRMLRAVRIASRFNFTIESETEKAILIHAKELMQSVAIERIVQELEKMARFPNFKEALLKLFKLGLLGSIFPSLKVLSKAQFESLICHLSNLPRYLPLIAYLNELFPQNTLLERRTLVKTLKLSNDQLYFIEFFSQSESLFSDSVEDYEWAKFYAHPLSEQVEAVFIARSELPKREKLKDWHEKKRSELFFYIDKMRKKQLIVSSHDLIALGFTPGKQLGDALKKAERIAINQKLRQKEEILKALLHS